MKILAREQPASYGSYALPIDQPQKSHNNNKVLAGLRVKEEQYFRM